MELRATSELNSLHRLRLNDYYTDEEMDALMTSIQEVGIQIPIDIDEENRILHGLRRYIAASRLGIEKVPVQVWVRKETGLSRLEVIDDTGSILSRRGDDLQVTPMVQDEGRTLKVFLTTRGVRTGRFHSDQPNVSQTPQTNDLGIQEDEDAFFDMEDEP